MTKTETKKKKKMATVITIPTSPKKDSSPKLLEGPKVVDPVTPDASPKTSKPPTSNKPSDPDRDRVESEGPYPWASIVSQVFQDNFNNTDDGLMTNVDHMDKLQESRDHIKNIKKIQKNYEQKLQNTKKHFNELKNLSNSTFDKLNAKVRSLEHEKSRLSTILDSIQRKSRYVELRNHIINTAMVCIMRNPKMSLENLQRKVRRETYTFLQQRVKVVRHIRSRSIYSENIRDLQCCIKVTKQELLNLIDMYCRVLVAA